jgi:hypothetical protein
LTPGHGTDTIGLLGGIGVVGPDVLSDVHSIRGQVDVSIVEMSISWLAVRLTATSPATTRR